MLEFIDKTGVNKRPLAESDEADSWDIQRLDRERRYMTKGSERSDAGTKRKENRRVLSPKAVVTLQSRDSEQDGTVKH